jgi:hypothetical protein
MDKGPVRALSTIESQEAVTASCCVGVAVTLAAFEKRKAVIVAGGLRPAHALVSAPRSP